MSWSAQAELGLKIPGETGVRQQWRQQQLERERQKCKRSPGLPWAAKITNLEQSADPTHLPIYLTNDVMLFIGRPPLELLRDRVPRLAASSTSNEENEKCSAVKGWWGSVSAAPTTSPAPVLGVLRSAGPP